MPPVNELLSMFAGFSLSPSLQPSAPALPPTYTDWVELGAARQAPGATPVASLCWLSSSTRTRDQGCFGTQRMWERRLQVWAKGTLLKPQRPSRREVLLPFLLPILNFKTPLNPKCLWLRLQDKIKFKKEWHQANLYRLSPQKTWPSISKEMID